MFAIEKISTTTERAIRFHMAHGLTDFYIGAWYYQIDNGVIKRCIQGEGLLPLNDWSVIGRYDNDTNDYIFYTK